MIAGKKIKRGAKHSRAIPAAILFTVALFLSVTLHVYLALSEVSLVAFVGLSVLSSFIVYFGPRLRKADIAKLQFEIDKIEETEASVKEVAAAIIDVLETKSHVLMLESYDSDAAEAAMKKLKKLIS